jgi:hypothetical protein
VLEHLGWHKCMAYCLNIGGVSGFGVEEISASTELGTALTGLMAAHP